MNKIDMEEFESVVLPTLSPASSLEAKIMALDIAHVCSTSSIGRQKVSTIDALKNLGALCKDEDLAVSKKSMAILANLFEDAEIVKKFLGTAEYSDFGTRALVHILDPDFDLADTLCMMLSNLTRFDDSAEIVARGILDGHLSMAEIVKAITHLNYNKKGAHLNHLALVVCNLTQVAQVRSCLLDEKTKLITKVMPFLSFKKSVIRRRGCAGILKNCCFESGKHEWLLGEEVDLLPALLLPLAGPEEFDEEDNESLPIDLQYLPPDKTRESEADIRKMLVEAVFRLCATKSGRLFVKKNNTYIIMRELHKWETDPANDVAIQNLIDILIGDEPEEGLEDLHKIEIPDHLKEKFHKEDDDDMNEINKLRSKMLEKD